MGESKLPIYAYVDETGNTGHNLFDEVQPDFYTGALITKGDFDLSFGNRTREIAASFGTSSLHGKELGLNRLESVAGDVLRLLERARAHFFVSRVEKKYLLVSKMFDSIFDSGENAAVGWHHYNFRVLRLLLVFKLSVTIEEHTARLFWRCILDPNEKKAYELLPQVCEALLCNIDRIPDKKSKQVIGEGLEWARTHPESIQIHIDQKTARQGHFPNLVAFANLLQGLEDYSTRWKTPVARISHDQQSEFQKTIEAWHGMFSGASGEEIRWAGETYRLQKVPGSDFAILEDSQSPGIQMIDIVLWLYAQLRKGKTLPPRCMALLNFVFEHGWESDFSFAGVERQVSAKLEVVMSSPFPPEKETEARSILERMEQARQASMAQYELDRTPPFLRTAKSKLEENSSTQAAPQLPGNEY